MTESMIDVGGGDKVWADDTGAGPPLVLLHPGIGDSRVWDPLLPALQERYRVIRFDARAYGRSPAPTVPYVQLDDLVSVLDHYGLERAALVGCSQGGDCAVGLAVTQPSRVSALVLLCPGITGYPVPEDPATDAAFDAAEPAGADAIAEVALGLWARSGRTPEAVSQLRSGARAWLAQGEFQQPNPAVFDRLGEIAVPTALLVGDLDRDWIIESNRIAASRIPGCVFVEVPGVDHLPSLRVPSRIVELIQATVPA
jgi:pimeloyl-ACP methyl ester carboxylesterase